MPASNRSERTDSTPAVRVWRVIAARGSGGDTGTGHGVTETRSNKQECLRALVPPWFAGIDSATSVHADHGAARAEAVGLVPDINVPNDPFGSAEIDDARFAASRNPISYL